MFIGVQRKTTYQILLVLFMMHVPLHAVTSTQAKVGAGLLAVLGGSIGSAISDEQSRPAVMCGMALISGIAAYSYLKKLTPKARLTQAAIILNEVAKDEMVKNYQEIYAPNKMASEQFKEKIALSYQQNIERDMFPQIIAFNQFASYQRQLESAHELIRLAK